ncbi:MAG: hypothetical protein WDO69_16405 [Pseudomonadota bacterium]
MGAAHAALLLALALGCSSSAPREFSAAGGAGPGGGGSGGAAGVSDSVTSDAGDGGTSEWSAAAGEGGTSDPGGAAGETMEAGGPSSEEGGAQSAGETGTGGQSTGGTGGTLLGDGGSGTAGACSPVNWFPDADDDDFGRTTAQISACSAPASGKWVSKGGDCNDDDPSVFPQEKAYKSSGYAVSGGVSFDYDCSSQEEADPSQLGAAPACASLLVLNCTGSGFANTNRTGHGVNPLCGSKTLVTCAVKDALFCEGLSTQVSEGVRCR